MPDQSNADEAGRGPGTPAGATLPLSEDGFRQVFEHSAAATSVVRLSDGVYLDVNEAWTRAFGRSRSEVIGKTSVQFGLWQEPRRREELFRTLREGGSVRDLEFAFRRASGETCVLLISADVTVIGGERVILSSGLDVTEIKRAERALHALDAQIGEMARYQVARQTLVAMAHELHQPLAATSLYCEAALKMLEAGDAQPERLRAALAGSSEQALRAGRVVRQMVDYLGRKAIETEPIDIGDLVSTVVARARADFAIGGNCRLDLALPRTKVQANRLQVESVLLNLVRNAVEALNLAGAAPKSITVSVGASPDAAMAQVAVRDNGPGIAADIQPRLFEPFFSTKSDGLGMGLAISREIIETHGGRLWVESEPGQGASFFFTLPLAA